MRFSRKGIGGSNPSVSAKDKLNENTSTKAILKYLSVF
jgi:hypothetical protein